MNRLIKFVGRTLILIFIVVNIITAFHAYKFTHFYDHADLNSNHNKNGFSKLKDVLFGIDMPKKPSILPKNDSAEWVYLTTKDSLKLQGWYIKNRKSAKGTVILFHGHGSNKAAIIAESDDFNKLGYNTFLLDFRAHGNSDGNVTTIGYYEGEDVKLAYDYIKGKGENNIILWGISMGAAAITKSIYDYNLQPSKIILEMPYGSILKAAEGRIKMMHLAAEPLATFITFWGGVEHGFWAFNMNPESFAEKINCPVLLQWGAKDPRVTLGEIETIYANIHTKKKLVIYDAAAHESLCEKENVKWVTEITEFLQK